MQALFAFSQVELSRYLDVKTEQVALEEAGRRTFSDAAREERWLQHLEVNAAALPSGGPCFAHC